MGRKYLGGSGESLTVWISVLVYTVLTCSMMIDR